MFNRLGAEQKNNISLSKFMRFLSSESELLGNKLSKSIWFLIFEYQVTRMYIGRESSEKFSGSPDPQIQILKIWTV